MPYCDLSGFEDTTMTVIGWIQILLYCAIVVALVKPLGWYMTRVFNGEPTYFAYCFVIGCQAARSLSTAMFHYGCLADPKHGVA